MDWALQLMITQLYDTTMEVCDVAVMYLEKVCTDPASLEKVVQLRPTLEHLGEVGYPLFMRYAQSHRTLIQMANIATALCRHQSVSDTLTRRSTLSVSSTPGSLYVTKRFCPE